MWHELGDKKAKEFYWSVCFSALDVDDDVDVGLKQLVGGARTPQIYFFKTAAFSVKPAITFQSFLLNYDDDSEV